MDNNFLDSIVKTTKSILTIYQRLCDLELAGKKDSIEYKQYMKYLEVAKEVEDDQYNRLYLSHPQMIVLANGFLEKIKTPEFPVDISFLQEEASDELIYRRILGKINDKISNSLKVEMSVQDAFQVFFFRGIKARDLIDAEISNLFLVMLDEKLSVPENVVMFSSASRVKYLLSFVMGNMECDMLSSFFTANRIHYFSNEFVDTNKRDFNVLSQKRAINLIVNHANVLLDRTDEEMKDDSLALDSLLREALMDAVFLLVHPKDLDNLRGHFNYLSDIGNYEGRSISEKRMRDVFSRIDSNRKKYYQQSSQLKKDFD